MPVRVGAPDAVGVIVAISHDAVVYCEFEEATPKVQAYYLHELVEVKEDDAAAAAQEGMAQADANSAVVCPLTLSPFREPVCTEDGESYERNAWQELCARSPSGPFVRSPCTRAMISTKSYPNRALRRMVEAEQARMAEERREREGEEDNGEQKEEEKEEEKEEHDGEERGEDDPDTDMVVVDGSEEEKEEEEPSSSSSSSS